ncbi:MAG: hypothetical protein QM754_18710 [Tepidisphaeraceae bacterium]
MLSATRLAKQAERDGGVAADVVVVVLGEDFKIVALPRVAKAVQGITDGDLHGLVRVIDHRQQAVFGVGQLQRADRHRTGEADDGRRIGHRGEQAQRTLDAERSLRGFDGVGADKRVFRREIASNFPFRRLAEGRVDRRRFVFRRCGRQLVLARRQVVAAAWCLTAEHEHRKTEHQTDSR